MAAKAAASNPLGALLDAHWPGAKQVFSRLGSQIAWRSLDAYPTPESGSPPRPSPPGRLLRRHSYAVALARPSCSGGYGRHSQQLPVGLAPEVLAELVAAQVRLLRTLLATIAGLIGHWGPGCWGMPRPGCWPRSHASARSAWPKSWPRSARSWTAPAPSSTPRPSAGRRSPKRPGKSKAVTFRWAANTKARNALATFAGNSRLSPWAAKVYADARHRGKHHPAVRIPRSGLAAGHVGLLAQRYDLRPRQARRRTAARRRT